ncbi:MAG TPA: FtsW/RodA/SpoVE family cell cycle protein, partial [Rectinemataceae bacterium]|nr:FtsW/RodA/SpoVE family cell cycle protein [Rectinemataceae bacterium]
MTTIAPERLLDRDRAASDGILASGLFLAAGTGMAVLWSASTGYAISLGHASWWFAARQAAFWVPAIAIFAAAAFVPLERLRKGIGILTLLGLVLLVLPFLPVIGERRNGAARWIDLGFTTVQPSEFWKPIAIVYLAHVLDRRGRARGDTHPSSLVGPFVLVSFGALLVYLQNDFSTAVIAMVAVAAVFWIAGAPLGAFAGLGFAGTALGTLMVLTSDFRLRRILSFLFPSYEPHGQSYQILASLHAIREGGWFGKGFGLGTLKIGSIPEVQSDFVFASFSEEVGFFGVLLFFALWGLVTWRAFSNALRDEDRFRSLLGFGLGFLLALEILINTAVAAGVVPATGIALPFFSAGGSSLMASAAIAGIL